MCVSFLTQTERSLKLGPCVSGRFPGWKKSTSLELEDSDPTSSLTSEVQQCPAGNLFRFFSTVDSPASHGPCLESESLGDHRQEAHLASRAALGPPLRPWPSCTLSAASGHPRSCHPWAVLRERVGREDERKGDPHRVQWKPWGHGSLVPHSPAGMASWDPDRGHGCQLSHGGRQGHPMAPPWMFQGLDSRCSAGRSPVFSHQYLSLLHLFLGNLTRKEIY